MHTPNTACDVQIYLFSFAHRLVIVSTRSEKDPKVIVISTAQHSEFRGFPRISTSVSFPISPFSRFFLSHPSSNPTTTAWTSTDYSIFEQPWAGRNSRMARQRRLPGENLHRILFRFLRPVQPARSFLGSEEWEFSSAAFSFVPAHDIGWSFAIFRKNASLVAFLRNWCLGQTIGDFKFSENFLSSLWFLPQIGPPLEFNQFLGFPSTQLN